MADPVFAVGDRVAVPTFGAGTGYELIYAVLAG
jgi:hypothetical protein